MHTALRLLIVLLGLLQSVEAASRKGPPQAFLEGAAGVNRHSNTPVVRAARHGQMAAALVGGFKANPFQNPKQLTGGQDRELLTAPFLL